MHVILVYVYPVDKELALLNVVELQQQVGYCGLATARGTDEARDDPGLDVEVHVEESLEGPVPEVEAFGLDRVLLGLGGGLTHPKRPST